jgi:transposase-like protein
MGKKESVPNRRYTEEFKAEAVRLALSTGGNAAAKRLGIPQSTMTNWVRQSREGRRLRRGRRCRSSVGLEVEAENARLRRELASARAVWSRKKAAAYFAKRVAVRYAWIEQHRDDYATTRMCQLLEVSRTGYLQWRGRPPSARAQANARLDAQVAAMHAASRGSYGRPRIVRGLREQGLRVGPERVRRSLQRQALRPVYKRPYRVTTDSNHRKPIAPNLLERRFDGWGINRAGLPTSPISAPSRAGCIWRW